MFAWWSSTVIRARWLMLAAGLVLAVAGAVWGSGVFASLTNGGFDDPASDSAKVQQIAARLGTQTPDVVVLYSSRGATAGDPAFRGPVAAALHALERRREVAHVVSYYQGAGGLVSRDRHATYAEITLTAPGDTGKRAAYQSLRPALGVQGVRTQVGGLTAFNVVTDDLTKQDVTKGEMLAMPVVLVLLVFIFGGLVAAGMPLLIGVLAILGSLTLTRLLTEITDVSTFAVNIITVLSLGMAIDYSLLIISRFREHLRMGKDTPAAVAATMATAGRTVLASGTIICLSLASLLIFPQVFLRSMGLGGIAAVLLAMTGALTVLPALLALAGPRINALRIPLAGRNRRTRQGADPGPGVWAALARAVMLRPVHYLVAVAAVLAILAIPFGHVHFGGLDERILPPGSHTRRGDDARRRPYRPGHGRHPQPRRLPPMDDRDHGHGHPGPVVPRVRVGPAAGQGGRDEPGVDRRIIRRRGLGLPGRPPLPPARLHRYRVPGTLHTGLPAGRAVWPGHRLRGVPAGPGTRGIRRHRRQHHRGRHRTATHRPDHHLRRAAAHRGPGWLGHRPGRLRQDHRDWHAHRHHGGRGPRADTPRSRDHATARPLELVGPWPPRRPLPPIRHQRNHRRLPRGAPADHARTHGITPPPRGRPCRVPKVRLSL